MPYGATVRVVEASEQCRGPFAWALPSACQFAVAPASTRATAATPSATLLPDASSNFTWIVYVLGLLL